MSTRLVKAFIRLARRIERIGRYGDIAVAHAMSYTYGVLIELVNETNIDGIPSLNRKDEVIIIDMIDNINETMQ